MTTDNERAQFTLRSTWNGRTWLEEEAHELEEEAHETVRKGGVGHNPLPRPEDFPLDPVSGLSEPSISRRRYYTSQLTWFQTWMRYKLEKNRHKDGWLNDADLWWLLDKAEDELREARDAVEALKRVEKDSGKRLEALLQVLTEFADVANVMFIAAVALVEGKMVDKISGLEEV